MNQALVDVSQVMPAAVATGLFVSTVTVQQWDGTLGASGAPDKSEAHWTNISGLINIAAMVAPPSTGITATENKSAAEILAEGWRHILLDSNYPALLAGWRQGWRLKETNSVTGLTTTYDIRGVEADSQGQMTRVMVQKVTT